MKIKSLEIQNFKSIEDLVVVEPNPFSVFVGPNGAGKSNIFEALEFVNILSFLAPVTAIGFFGSPNELLKQQGFSFEMKFDSFVSSVRLVPHNKDTDTVLNGTISSNFLRKPHTIDSPDKKEYWDSDTFEQFIINFSRVFLRAERLKKINLSADSRLFIDGSNLEKVLKLLLQDQYKKEEITEWLKILIPEFKDIEIRVSELSGEVSFVIYENSTNKPFPKHLISDGTQNILGILAAVYQSDEPQFLCIEEPENGLHPQVIKELVSLFRTACEEKGHYIWLNTHSETLVRQLRPEELILVDKKNGATQVKQLKGFDTFGLEMDEAWLTNALNGGVI